ncbi:hypothetical protein ASG97_24680 [Bacillus sp. Soil745]|nr:hypothetical protein ASG97_24680 [Bacillus sp. Soil745]PAW26895.1 hypothetical protein BKC07_22485 [Peribacillus simplex]
MAWETRQARRGGSRPPAESESLKWKSNPPPITFIGWGCDHFRTTFLDKRVSSEFLYKLIGTEAEEAPLTARGKRVPGVEIKSTTQLHLLVGGVTIPEPLF